MKLLLTFFCLLSSSIAFGAVDEFVETFDGDGEFKSSGVIVEGFDNPDWELRGEGSFEPSGINLRAIPGIGQEGAISKIFRDVLGSGSFASTIVVHNYEFDHQPMLGSSAFQLVHWLNISDPVSIRLVTAWEDQWRVAIVSPENHHEFHVVQPAGESFELSLAFDIDELTTTYTYDFDLFDNIPAEVVDIVPYTGEISDAQISEAFVSTVWGAATATIDHWSLTNNILEGDFNDDAMLDISDIDLLMTEIQQGTNDTSFDLNRDNAVNNLDLRVWVLDLKNTFYGDSNLDGEFNTSDLVTVFQGGLYEAEEDAGWVTGDWNADGHFNSRDLVFVFQQGGYEEGPRVIAVPEPSCFWILLMVTTLIRRRSPKESDGAHNSKWGRG